MIRPREAFSVCLPAYVNGTAGHWIMVAGGRGLCQLKTESRCPRPLRTGWSAPVFVPVLALCYDFGQMRRGRTRWLGGNSRNLHWQRFPFSQRFCTVRNSVGANDNDMSRINTRGDTIEFINPVLLGDTAVLILNLLASLEDL